MRHIFTRKVKSTTSRFVGVLFSDVHQPIILPAYRIQGSTSSYSRHGITRKEMPHDDDVCLWIQSHRML